MSLKIKGIISNPDLNINKEFLVIEYSPYMDEYDITAVSEKDIKEFLKMQNESNEFLIWHSKEKKMYKYENGEMTYV